MTRIRRPRCGALLVAGVALFAVTLAGCGSEQLRQERLEREESLNVYPGNYRADLVAALHAYLSNPSNIRDAWVAEPAITPIGQQRKRYAACVRFNARNSDGRYAGSKDVLAVFASGRFDQFIEPPVDPAIQGDATSFVKELCDKTEYRRFPELEAIKR
jgi:hypothetical protein